MARDIEEFLRMAAQRRQQQKQKQKQQSRPAPPQPPPAQEPPVRSIAAEPTVYDLAATDDEIHVIDSGRKVTDIRHGSVREHVESHIDTSGIAEKVSHLGEQVGLADDKLEHRLHQKFDHEVGHLQIGDHSAQSETTSVTKQAQSKTATDLMDLFSNPASIRQAIIINEVLKRPEFD